MLENALIYLNKQSSEYARILNVSDAINNVINYTLKMEYFAKRIMLEFG